MCFIFAYYTWLSIKKILALKPRGVHSFLVNVINLFQDFMPFLFFVLITNFTDYFADRSTVQAFMDYKNSPQSDANDYDASNYLSICYIVISLQIARLILIALALKYRALRSFIYGVETLILTLELVLPQA